MIATSRLVSSGPSTVIDVACSGCSVPRTTMRSKSTVRFERPLTRPADCARTTRPRSTVPPGRTTRPSWAVARSTRATTRSPSLLVSEDRPVSSTTRISVPPGITRVSRRGPGSPVPATAPGSIGSAAGPTRSTGSAAGRDGSRGRRRLGRAAPDGAAASRAPGARAGAAERCARRSAGAGSGARVDRRRIGRCAGGRRRLLLERGDALLERLGVRVGRVLCQGSAGTRPAAIPITTTSAAFVRFIGNSPISFRPIPLQRLCRNRRWPPSRLESLLEFNDLR